MSARAALALACVLMFVAVGAGAFGAHALRQRLTPDLLDVWRTAVQYHAWHALALALVGVLMLHWPGRVPLLAPAGWCFVAGVVLFSGSLYALALSGVRALGAVTPVGGVAFLAGWALLAWAVSR
jgi:uncharacterized membrane protein YgdD (TMEM256/DUF423 family)